MPGATTLDRIIVAAVAVLIAAFTLGSLGPLVSPASGDEVAGTRDDDAAEIEALEETDDDGDPFARGDSNSGGDNSRSGNSGSRSIGSNSANTRSGTTRGTGVSKTVSDSGDNSKNTKTGTTRGTGPSNTVSNSS